MLKKNLLFCNGYLVHLVYHVKSLAVNLGTREGKRFSKQISKLNYFMVQTNKIRILPIYKGKKTGGKKLLLIN